jgi:hypothetical protein
MTKSSGIKVKSSVKAGGLNMNHTRPALKVRAGVKAGGYCPAGLLC